MSDIESIAKLVRESRTAFGLATEVVARFENRDLAPLMDAALQVSALSEKFKDQLGTFEDVFNDLGRIAFLETAPLPKHYWESLRAFSESAKTFAFPLSATIPYSVHEGIDGDAPELATQDLVVWQRDWTRIYEEIARDESRLDRMQPREFEGFVAEMFEKEGWDVELTQRTRDGGYDIIALRRSGLVTQRLLIEAKRYAPSHTVGVGIVRALWGVRDNNPASQLLLATTSHVSDDAKQEFCRFTPWALDFLERDRIIDWCLNNGGVAVSSVQS